MEGKNLQFAEISRVKEVASQYSQLDNAYIFARLLPGAKPEIGISDGMKRFDGLMFMILRKGCVEIEVNFERYLARDNTLIAMAPGSLFRVSAQGLDHVDASLVFITNDFLHEINLNPSAINLQPLQKKRTPIYRLTTGQTEHLSSYLDLFHRNSYENTHQRLVANIAANLIAAIFYQLMQFLYLNVEMSSVGHKPTRRTNYVNDFLKLVHIYYNRERSVAFYAAKLFISPKYLSLLVKETTGKSAARIIDEFVLLEAKNMLRFSGKNIQQVAYALNFSTQSSFGKYFKHLTGMSPTEYQKS